VAVASIADVQQVLHDDEALLVFLDTADRFKPLPEETFIWVVTKREVRWLRSGSKSAKNEPKVGARLRAMHVDQPGHRRLTPAHITGTFPLLSGPKPRSLARPALAPLPHVGGRAPSATRVSLQ
jgi:hypothetical protein